MKLIREMAVNFIILYVVVVGGLYFAQRSLIYYPDKNFPAIGELKDAGFVRVATDDGMSVIGWYSPAREGKKTILYFHGNAGNIAHRVPIVKPFIEEGYGVMLAEYRGYGGNPGKPSEEGFYHDARAYYAWLTHQQQVPPADIVLYGESIGSGPAIQMASENPDTAALFLVTPFARMSDVAKKNLFFLPIDWCLKDKFDNIEKIADLSLPKFFFVAGRDEVIPHESGKALFDHAVLPKVRYDFPEAGHNTIFNRAFVDKALEALRGLPSA